MKDDIDNFLEKKYKDVEVPDGIFDFEKIFEKGDAIKKRRKKIKSITSIAAALVVVVVAVTIILVRNNNDGKVIQQSGTQIENNKITGYVKEIEVKKNLKIFEVGKFNEKVYSIKQIKIIEQSVTSNTENEIYPITKIKAEVLNTFKGEEVKEITFWVPGGVVTVEELKATDFIYDANELNGLKNEDKIYIKYYEQYKMAMPTNENTYVVTLKKVDGEFYVKNEAKYGFKEYDPETNSIKLSDNQWETFNVEEYLK